MNLDKGLMAGLVLGAMGSELVSPGVARRMEEGFHLINRRARWRGMMNCNESPWVTYRHDIRTGKAKLIRRPNKPPLLVAVKPRRGSR